LSSSSSSSVRQLTSSSIGSLFDHFSHWSAPSSSSSQFAGSTIGPGPSVPSSTINSGLSAENSLSSQFAGSTVDRGPLSAGLSASSSHSTIDSGPNVLSSLSSQFVGSAVGPGPSVPSSTISSGLNSLSSQFAGSTVDLGPSSSLSAGRSALSSLSSQFTGSTVGPSSSLRQLTSGSGPNIPSSSSSSGSLIEPSSRSSSSTDSSLGSSLASSHSPKINDEEDLGPAFSWTPQRDAQLVEIYLRHYRDQTTLNGLKKSSWKYVTNFFNALSPGNPPLTLLQIKNRFQKLKQTWMLYRDLQCRSGVSWDAEECTITMPSESWKGLNRDWAKRNVLSLISGGVRRSNLKDWKSKPFPLFHMLSAIHEGKAFTGENIASFDKTFTEVETILKSAVVDPDEISNQELVVPEQHAPPSVGQRKSMPKPKKPRRNLITLMQEHFSHQDKTASIVGEAITYIAGLKSQFSSLTDYMAIIKKITQHEATVLFALPEVDRLPYLKSLLTD
jgi:hypothetical protein